MKNLWLKLRGNKKVPAVQKWGGSALLPRERDVIKREKVCFSDEFVDFIFRCGSSTSLATLLCWGSESIHARPYGSKLHCFVPTQRQSIKKEKPTGFFFLLFIQLKHITFFFTLFPFLNMPIDSLKSCGIHALNA